MKDAQQKELDQLKQQHEKNIRNIKDDYQDKVRVCKFYENMLQKLY